MLIPQDVVKAVVSELPIVAAVLKRLAKQSHVSELAAALRIANLAGELGLENAAVVFFEGDAVSWQWSRTLSMPDDTAISLRDAARKAAPNAFRHARKKLATCSLHHWSRIHSSVLPPCSCSCCQRSTASKSRGTSDAAEIEEYLFDGQVTFQRQLQGCFGAFKPLVKGMSASEAEDTFWERYERRFAGVPEKRLTSPKGREYVRLRLEEWCER